MKEYHTFDIPDEPGLWRPEIKFRQKKDSSNSRSSSRCCPQQPGIAERSTCIVHELFESLLLLGVRVIPLSVDCLSLGYRQRVPGSWEPKVDRDYQWKTSRTATMPQFD